MPDTGEPLQPNAASDAGNVLTEFRNLRFAVGSFNSSPQFQRALDDLLRRGFAFESFNCLAPRHGLAGETPLTFSVDELAFPEGPVCCTAGPLHDCLRARLDAGARSLRNALGYWLVPRHAAYFQAAIESGKIQLWIRLTNGEDERQAYQSLLACSSNSVGVHDLMPSLRSNGAGS